MSLGGSDDYWALCVLLTCDLSNHSLRDPSIGQERLDLLFDHRTIPPATSSHNKYNICLNLKRQKTMLNTAFTLHHQL